MKNIKYLLFLILFTTSTSSQNSDWVYRNPQPQNDFYAIKFFDQNTGYVCGSKGIILKTVTGDNLWLNFSIGQTRNLYSMYFFNVNHGIIVGDSGLIIRTTNGGTNWLRVTTGLSGALRCITFVNSTTGFIAGDNGVILKSTTDGTTWQVINNNSRNLRNIFFLDANTGFTVGDSGIFMKTSNAGANWSSQTLGGMNLTCVWFTNQNTGYLTTEFSAPLKTTDGGLTWNTMDMDYMNGSTNCVKFTDQNTGFIVGQYIPIAKTTNAGLNWLEWNSNDLFMRNTMFDISFADTFLFISGIKGCLLRKSENTTKFLGGSKDNFSAISFINENTGAAVGENKYLRTTNGGLNWNIDLIGGFNWFEGNIGYSTYIHFYSTTSGYRIMYNFAPGHWYFIEYLQKSTDAGLTWNITFGPAIGSIYAISETSGPTYIATSSGIYKNSGSGWDTVYNPNPGIGYQDISFANQNTGIAIFNNPYEGYVRTSDGGSSWSLIPFTNTIDMNKIQLLPSGTGYIIGDSTLLSKTTDYGVSWNFIPHSILLDFLDEQFIDDNTGWLTGRFLSSPYSSRLYYTSNGGNDLIQIQSLCSFDVKGMSFINALTGFVSGDSGVVLKTTNGGLSFVNPISYNVPDKFSLYQNYPNPFNPVTRIKFDITKREAVKLKIFDLLGREIKTLVNEQLQPGTYEFEWDGTKYSSGIYFYEIISDKYTETRKMVLIK